MGWPVRFRLEIGLGVIALVAAMVATASGLVVADGHYPVSDGLRPFEVPASARALQRWRAGQGWAIGVHLFAAACALVVVARPSSPTRGRRALTIGLLLVTVVAGVAGFVTGDLVRWEQVGLERVPSAVSDVSGYRFAATSDDVSFIRVAGRDVTQAAYARNVVAHLAALVVAPVAIAVALPGLVGLRRPTRSGSVRPETSTSR